MNFLKKNIPLLSAFVITFILSVSMIVLDVGQYFSIQDANVEIEQNVTKIQDIAKKKPRPLDKNVKNIEADIRVYRQKLTELQRMFGKFYRTDLVKFAAAVGVDENRILSDFREYYTGLPEDKRADITGEKDKAILEDFLEEYYILNDPADSVSTDGEKTPEKNEKTAPSGDDSAKEPASEEKKLTPAQERRKAAVQKAVDDFTAGISRISYEIDNDYYEYMLDALGLPRTELATTFKRLLAQCNEKLTSEEVIPGAESVKTVSGFTFGSNDIPPQREIFLACRQMQILTDLFLRMKRTKIVALSKLERPALAGEPLENGAYLRYTYRMELLGPLDAIRNFVNDLGDAFKQNIVYNVRDLSLARPVPEDVAKLTELSDSGMTSVRDKDGKLSSDYGRTVVGSDRNVRCNLTVDFIMYAGDLLQRTQPPAK